ncbi:CBN-KCA-1 protein [Caenorhabditis brenneri]|uniref:CBN-KCA-1 protein n=1 Tax=Caenorhabditis brenneri TaxID=135651 RepID=G0P6Z4_CAEBE|nr:CBN-KCA-1 protein [Caenorhabditis brenneri]
MQVDDSAVVIGEDALSTYYSTSSNSNSSSAASSASTPLTTSTTSSSSIMSSSIDRHEAGILNFFRRRSWFGFGPSAHEEKKKHDTVTEIMKCFRNNDVDGMEKFLGDRMDGPSDDNKPGIQKTEQESEMWWDDEKVVDLVPSPKIVLGCKYTPHPRKGVSKLPPRVLKAVRFDMENTPEDREKRPFTPMYTSTPKHAEWEHGSESEDELPPLRDCDSNTVIPPSNIHNNTSSILLANTSVMVSLNKCRQQTIDAVCLPSDKNSYKICYDDTDEEEVVEEEIGREETPTPSRHTFVVSKESSDHGSKTISLQEQSIDQLNISTNSSVVLGLDCIESYIQHLEDEIEAANRYAREKDMKRAIGAVRQARHLQERFGQMNENINEMCNKLPKCLEQPTENDCFIDSKNVSSVFEDSRWGSQLGLEAGSFDDNQL